MNLKTWWAKIVSALWKKEAEAIAEDKERILDKFKSENWTMEQMAAETDRILSQFKTDEWWDKTQEKLLKIDIETLNDKAIKWGLDDEGKLVFLGYCTIAERTALAKKYDPATDFEKAWEIGMAGIRRSKQ